VLSSTRTAGVCVPVTTVPALGDLGEKRVANRALPGASAAGGLPVHGGSNFGRGANPPSSTTQPSMR